RCSSVCAYYTPFSERPNLTVLTEVLATKMLWDRSSPPGTKPRAIGVEFRSTNGQTTRIRVRREVILSAGAIGSPKFLELSGVGNASILLSAGVEPVLDMPTIGENLADHVHSWANAFTNAILTRDSIRLDPEFEQQQRALWYHNQTGNYKHFLKTVFVILIEFNHRTTIGCSSIPGACSSISAL
ncbi:hypothetical protein GALMADRAFT_80185, partial [Galerina marginata CBS 339.88]